MISVIVPVYNTEKYLNRCVDSILAQTYRDLEIILVDDGSTDRSPFLCDEYLRKDERIRVLHKPNGGLSDARNVGIDAASGELIGFVDSDDYIAPDMYQKLYTRLIQEQADICICGWIYVYENSGQETMEYTLPDERLDSMGALEKLQEAHDWYYVTAWNKLYVRSLFEKVRFPNGRLYEDEAVAHQLFYAAKTVMSISDSLYYYVQRDKSIMHAEATVRSFDRVWALIDRMNFYQENGLEQMNQFVYRKARYHYARLRGKVKPRSIKERRKVHALDRQMYQLSKVYTTDHKWHLFLSYKMTDLYMLFHRGQ